jgi:hypothetical protein
MCCRRYALDSPASRFAGRSLEASVTRTPIGGRSLGYHAGRARRRRAGRSASLIDPDATLRARERALGFVEARGDELARRRARALVGRASADGVVEWLAGAQFPDGAFCADPARKAAASLAATRCALGVLADLGALHAELVARAVDCLVAAQRADGSWAPERDASEPAALEATGRIAGLLARTPCARATSPEAAAEWLAARFLPERVQGFAWGPLAAYAATFANVAHESSDAILQWCGRELERAFRAGAFDAARTARILLDCDAPSLPGSRLAPAELAAALLREQAPDGGWPAASGVDPSRVAPTLDALAALARFGPAAPLR